jgi:hypothetical protein
MSSSPPREPARRPTLYFGAEEVASLRARAATTHRTYFDALRAWTDRNLHREPLIGVDEAFLHESSEVYFEEAFSHLTNVMLTHLITGEDAYAASARRWLRALAEYPTGGGSQYSVGPHIAALAQGYDWLSDILTAEEKELIWSQLVRLVRDAHDCSLAPGRAWWYAAHLHHDFWIPTAGYGIGALAIRDEVPEAQQWADRAAEELFHAMDLLGDDGAWHEGAADWVYGLVLTLLFADAYRRAGGRSLYEHPWLKNTWRYRLYCWLPDDTYVNLNDSFRSGRYNILGSASSHVARRLAGEYRNGYMQWLASRDEAIDYAPTHPGVYRSPYDWTVNQPYPTSLMHCLGWNFLWYDPSVAATPPDQQLPSSHHFTNQGVVIARTGWDEASSVVTFSCAPVGGHEARRRVIEGDERIARGLSHTHAQATGFTLYAGGKYLIVPPGYGKHASRFQNVMTINGSGQLWGPERLAEIRAVDLTPDVDYVLGDATGCYPAEFGIRRHQRHLVFLKPDFLIIADVVEADGFASGQGRHYVWQIHTDPRVVEATSTSEGISLRALDGSSGADLRILQPEIFGHVRARYSAADGTPILDQSGVVQAFAVPRLATFLVVVALTELGRSTQIERIDGTNCFGALIGGANDARAIVFANGASSESTDYRVEPARSARHLVAGLPAGQQYQATTTLRPRSNRWAERALRISEENFVSETVVSQADSGIPARQGLLRFNG